MKNGKVYLVGAGAGDCELLTVKAERLIREADVVVFDRLVDDSILELISQNAEKIYVGKNAGNHSVPQEEISKMLAKLAMENKIVVRLKGGDPFLFGRGGEELEEIFSQGVEFEVVPGISSAIAVPAYAGIPVTHRDFCSSLHIVSGHAKAGSPLKIDYNSLAKLGGTLVFLMSVSSISQIASGLIANGMEEKTPCAVVENGAKSNQRKFISDLSNIAQTTLDNAVKSPSIFIVGKVATLSRKFDWFSKKPLKGVKILATQRKKTSSKIVPKLRALGCEVKSVYSIETERITPQNLNLEDYSTIAFSSIEGVESFFEYLYSKSLDARILHGKKVVCIGSQTANALRKMGINPDFTPSIFCGKNMATEMIDAEYITQKDYILLVRPQDGSQEILKTLSHGGMKFADVPFYKTTHINNEEIDLSEYDYITFTSKSGVESFAKSNAKNKTKTTAICIGEQTASSAKAHGFQTVVADRAEISSMLEKIIDLSKRG